MVLWSGDLFCSVNGVSHKHIDTCQNNLEHNISQSTAPTETHLQAKSGRKAPDLAAMNLPNQNLDLQKERGSVGTTPASQNSLEFKTELKEVKGGVSDQQTRRCRL